MHERRITFFPLIGWNSTRQSDWIYTSQSVHRLRFSYLFCCVVDWLPRFIIQPLRASDNSVRQGRRSVDLCIIWPKHLNLFRLRLFWRLNPKFLYLMPNLWATENILSPYLSNTTHDNVRTQAIFAYPLSLTVMFPNRIDVPVLILLFKFSLDSTGGFRANTTNASNWQVPVDPSVYRTKFYSLYDYPVRYKNPIVETWLIHVSWKSWRISKDNEMVGVAKRPLLENRVTISPYFLLVTTSSRCFRTDPRSQ